MWFVGLGRGARLLRLLRTPFTRAAARRRLDGGILLVMSGLAVPLDVRGLTTA